MSISIADWINTSIIPTVQWPPILDMDQSRHLLMLDYLEHYGEWLSAQQIHQEQKEQLWLLYLHAKQTSPYYQQVLPVASTAEELSVIWHNIPIIDTLLLEKLGNCFHSMSSPAAHGPNQKHRTNINLLHNKATLFFDELLLLREHIWHQRDFKATYAVLNNNFGCDRAANTIKTHNSWGYPVDSIVKTGLKTECISQDYSIILNWLIETKANYLDLTLEQCQRLIEHCKNERNLKCYLKQLIVPAQGMKQILRKQVQDVIGAQLIGSYNIPELGLIAVQCPETTHFHIQVENVFLEIINEESKSCPDGIKGRLVATHLHNFSSPLIRYDTGIQATLYNGCSCGRGASLLIIE